MPRRSNRCKPAVSSDVVRLVHKWHRIPGVLMRTGFLPYCVGEVEILSCDQFGIQAQCRWRKSKPLNLIFTERDDGALVTPDCKFALELRGQSEPAGDDARLARRHLLQEALCHRLGLSASHFVQTFFLEEPRRASRPCPGRL